MSDANIDREQELFHACVALPPAERAGYLERACGGDAAFRARIERLLAAHARAEHATLNPLNQLQVERLPDVIGPYEVVGMLGEGGMGVVYDAEQRHPVQRRVALKILKPGMDTRQVVSRFMLEQQALAAMDHPYVARVFDAGQTAAGRPYFAMELVPGEPLLAFSERNRLSVRERLDLFIRICQAVQHAHQKGVIHRDLKPSNVLVRADDTGPIPKIIDFGIAKAVVGEAPGAVSEMTRAGQALGTPAYMSPEQAGLGSTDVDTRSDVYALGVMLYELLTGSLPTDPATMGYTEFLARLSRGELVHDRPSTRAPGLEPDLDWIVMKALETDRERRYGTAAALANDLERFLRAEPISARPPTMVYRVGRFVRRHRMQVAAAAIAVAALLGGGIAATLGLIRATQAEAAARQDAATARQVSQFVVRLFEVSDPSEARGSSITARELLDRGAATIDRELRQQPVVRARLLGTLSRVHESLGLYRKAVSLGEQAVIAASTAGVSDDELATVLLTIGRSRQRVGEFEPARKALQQALDVSTRQHGDDQLAVVPALNALASLHWELGRHEEAKALHRRAIGIAERRGGPDHLEAARSLRGLGIVQNSAQEFKESLESHTRAQRIFEKEYGPDHPLVADTLDSLGLALENLNDLPRARRYFERALETRKRVLGPDHPAVAFSYHNLGHVLVGQGDLKAAVPLYEAGIRIREASLGPDNTFTASLVESLAIVRIRLGQLAEGTRMLERSLASYERAYGPDHDETIESHHNLVIALAMGKRYEEAVQHLRAVMFSRVDHGFRMNLKDTLFDPFRKLDSFRALEADIARRAAPQ